MQPMVAGVQRRPVGLAVAALELTLTDGEAAALEKPYSNHGPSWY
jgi:hypothetical protein